MNDKQTASSHEITLINAQKGTVTAVDKVISARGDCILLSTSLGELSITGKDFTISGYNEQSKTFSFSGKVTGLSYKGAKEPVFKKLFK